MSVQAIAWALKQKPDLPLQKFVLVVLSNYADEDGFCWPSQLRIASDTGLSERGVRDILSALESQGLISRSRRQDPVGKRRTDLIQLQSHRQIVPVEPPANGDQSHRQMTTDPPTPPYIAEPSEENRQICAKKVSHADAVFECFWRSMPKESRKGKLDARRAWTKALAKCDGDADMLIAAATRYSVTAAAPYIVHAATWLNKGRWLDEHTPQRGNAITRATDNVIAFLRSGGEGSLGDDRPFGRADAQGVPDIGTR